MKQLLVLFSLVFAVSCAKLAHFQPVGETPKKKLLTPAWIKTLDPEYSSGNLPIGLQSPLIHDGIVYAGHNSGYMQAYELGNGRLVWSELDGSTYHAGAIAHNDSIIYGTVQGRVIARHAILGTVKYSVDLGATVETRGVVHNGRILFQLRNHQVFCLDVETGKILWGYKRSVPYLTTLQRVSRPIVLNDKVLVGFADGSLVALTLDEGIVSYETKLSNGSKFVDVDNTPFIFDNKIYISPAQSPMSILDPNTGSVLRTTDFSVSRGPVIRGDAFLLGTPEGEIILADKMLNPIKTVKVARGAITGIVSYKGNFAVTSTAGKVYVINFNTLEIEDQFDLGHAYSAVFGEIQSTGNELAVISSRNRLYIFK